MPLEPERIMRIPVNKGGYEDQLVENLPWRYEVLGSIAESLKPAMVVHSRSPSTLKDTKFKVILLSDLQSLRPG